MTRVSDRSGPRIAISHDPALSADQSLQRSHLDDSDPSASSHRVQELLQSAAMNSNPDAPLDRGGDKPGLVPAPWLSDEQTSAASSASRQSILYSFRRCPYAIRARLSLAAAGMRPGADLELREVALKAKPPELLQASTKATVPVLLLPDSGTAPAPPLDESLAIMRWALKQADPQRWAQGWSQSEEQWMEELISENDAPFKHHLDRFKYAARHGASGPDEREEHRRRGLAILKKWNRALQDGGWLLGSRPCLADMALLPFVRQFRLADAEGFEHEAGLAELRSWLKRFEASAELATVMAAPWAPRRVWRSPQRVYHLALAEEWRAARASGVYEQSTRGLSLQDVGFIHASHVHQLQATWQRFYVDAGDVVLLHIDPDRLADAGVPVRLEPAPGSGELFPHLYGSLPLVAVVLAEPFPA